MLYEMIFKSSKAFPLYVESNFHATKSDVFSNFLNIITYITINNYIF